MNCLYHEFLAIETPLAVQEIHQLRASSPTSFISTTGIIHNNGIFPHDSQYLMRRFFDAHICLAPSRWCTFEVRVPRNILTDETILSIEAEPILDIEATDSHWLISWHSNLAPLSTHDVFDGSEWMSRLVPIRDELMCGDMRCVYLGWLAAVTHGDVSENDQEPMRWTGTITPPQQHLAELMRISPILLDAAMHQAETHAINRNTDATAWIQSLSVQELRDFIRGIVEGNTNLIEQEITLRFNAWKTHQETRSLLRTAATIWAQARQHPHQKKPALNE